jgi:F0F1-type ATP synthase assembly protein I
MVAAMSSGRSAKQLEGSDQVWAISATLVGGPLVWAAIGFGVDHLVGTRWFVVVGLVIGAVVSFWLAMTRERRMAEHPLVPKRRSDAAPGTSGAAGEPPRAEDPSGPQA